MKQEFATGELMAVLEGPLGFRIRSLERLPGKAWSLNFKAVREADGFEFVVKLVPATGNAAYEARFLTWCPGVRLFPDQLTVEQLKAFLDDYLAFARGMQKTTGIFPKRDGTALRKMVLNGLSGLLGKRLRRKIETDMSEADVTHRPELTQVVPGDFPSGNFLLKVSKRVRNGIGFIKVLNLLFRYAFYRELKAVAREAEELP